MSIKCPKCGTELTQDFGLVTCSGCSSVVSVDVDGNVALASEDFHQTASIQQVSEEPAPPLNQFANSYEQAAPISEISSEPISEPSAEFSAVPTMDSIPEQTLEPTPEPVITPTFEQPIEHNFELPTEIESEPAAVFEPKSAIQEIREFGNKEASTGPITYTVCIVGLDLPDRAKEVIQALSNPKFGWEHGSVSKYLKNGQIRLENLNPAQAVMVIQQLRGIHVQVSWTQSLYS